MASNSPHATIRTMPTVVNGVRHEEVSQMGFRDKRIDGFWLGWMIWVLPPTAAFAQGGAVVEAIAGEPLGVGRVVLDLPAQELPTPFRGGWS